MKRSCTKHSSATFALSILLSFFCSVSWAADDEATEGPSYVDLTPSFTLNYGDQRRNRYIQTSITVRITDKASEYSITDHADAIRHTIIMLFARQPDEIIRSSAGREELLNQLLIELQELMEKETGKPLIDRVLFTSFILQS